MMSALGCLACAAAPAAADPAAYLGIAFTFGGANSGKVGLTAKILSSEKEEDWVAGAGVTYFVGAPNDFGLDLSVGYNGSDNFSVLVGYDFLQYAPVGSLGWSDTKKEAASPPPS
ncbi:MAG: hypothetical protein FJX19_03365 [Alphaproteobacteria bacterium]|nr:hypothetical protein [Alphaproteobacteria bacterium]